MMLILASLLAIVIYDSDEHNDNTNDENDNPTRRMLRCTALCHTLLCMILCYTRLLLIYLLSQLCFQTLNVNVCLK